MSFSAGDTVYLNEGTRITRLAKGVPHRISAYEYNHYFDWQRRGEGIKINGDWYSTSNFTKEDPKMTASNFLVLSKGGSVIGRLKTMDKAKTLVSESLKANPAGEFAIYGLELVGKVASIPVDWETATTTVTDKL